MRRMKAEHWFGPQLRLARERKGWSQTTLALRAGFQPSAISHFELGRRDPTLTNAVRLARALGESMDRLCNIGSYL